MALPTPILSDSINTLFVSLFICNILCEIKKKDNINCHFLSNTSSLRNSIILYTFIKIVFIKINFNKIHFNKRQPTIAHDYYFFSNTSFTFCLPLFNKRATPSSLIFRRFAISFSFSFPRQCMIVTVF